MGLLHICSHGIVTQCKFMWSTHSESQQTEMFEFGAEKGLLQGHARRWVVCDPKPPEPLKGICQSIFFKARWGRGIVSCWKLLGVRTLCSCSCLYRSGHDVFVNLHQDKCYSLFCNFSCLYEGTLKDHNPKNRLSYIFQTIGNIFLQKVQSPLLQKV